MEKENIIYYFSGTGNTYWAAAKIAEQLSDCELIDIAKFDYSEEVKASRIGIFFPVYYWGLPNIIKKFASNANMETDYLFELHTMGGYDGVAVLQLTDYLKKNAHPLKLSASYRLKLPNNIALLSRSNVFTDVYRVPNEKTALKLFAKAENTISSFITKIYAKKENNYMEPLVCRPWRSFGYRLNERQCSAFQNKAGEFESKLDKNCTGCGKCSQVCPMNNITIQKGKPVWGSRCEFCLACLHACPVTAINIEYSKGKNRYHNPKL